MAKEYIEREALLKSNRWLALSANDIAQAKSIILGQPAADVVEVVRCKDCVYASRDGYICRYSVGRTTSPDDYCKNGEKRDGKGEGE